MAKKSSKYWQEQFLNIEKSSNAYGMQTYNQIEPAFNYAQKQIEKEIDIWVARVAKNNEVTMAEARKLLNAKELAEFKWDVKEFIKYGEENALDGMWIKELENASAKFHITRLEALKIRTQQEIERAFGNELDSVDRMISDVYNDTYYKGIYEIQKGFNVGFNVASIDQRKLDLLKVKPWATDGKNFSDRIWQSKKSMIGELHNELVKTCVLGKSPDEAIKNMTKFVDKKFKNAKAQAGRLVMTEQAFFSSAAQGQCFKDLDVEKFEIVATLDSHTSEICQNLDGEVFDMKDFQAGVTAPPFHVWCRSTTVPFFDDEFDFGGQRAARGEDGKTYYVPDNMKYKDWKNQFVKEDLKEDMKSDKIKVKVEDIPELTKLKNSGMTNEEYVEYFNIINNHSNPSIRNLYSVHANNIDKVKLTSGKGQYTPSTNSLVFDYPKYDGMNKYGTLAHEYAHFFDDKVQYEGLNFKEVEAVKNITGLNNKFKSVASSSDEFLAAIRKDKEHIKSIYTPTIKDELMKNNASAGVQDAIDGLFPNSRLKWGHGERYYNRKYADIEFMDKFAKTSRKKALQQLYKDMGFDASNQSKVKVICRQYEAASEMWANIMSAEVNGGQELEFVKKYLPNSYQAILEILKGVK